MKVLRNWHNYPQAYNKYDLQPNKIYKSWLKNKKLVVLVVKGYNKKIIHFGDKNYTNYGIHNNKQRLNSYLKRSAGIRDKKGQLTRNNPLSANYWSRKILWNSKLNGINYLLY